MPRTVNKKTYTLVDIWQDYVKQVLTEHPEYWTRFKNYMSNYVIYRKVGNRVEEVMSYVRYRKIVAEYITRAKKAIIKGEAVNITGSVGKICARRVERDFRATKKKVDYHKTRQQPLVEDPVTGKKKYAHVIYFSDDDWCRIGWHNTHKIKNEKVYEFKPTNPNSAGKGDTGFKAQFVAALRADPLLKYQYLYFTIKQNKETT